MSLFPKKQRSRMLSGRIIREDGTWYIHLPDYLDQGWSKSDLAMMEGTGKLLNTFARGRNEVSLRLSEEPFPGADVLELVEHCSAPRGGAIYLVEKCGDKSLNKLIWVCDIALFVFGDMPDRIYIQCLSGRLNPS